MSDIGGVWRTVGGRRIFIKDGQDLATAMKTSGKFNKNRNNNVSLFNENIIERDFKKLNTKTENLIVYNSKLKTLQKINGNNESSVGNLKTLMLFATSKKHSLIAVHNHPHNSSFSLTDMTTFNRFNSLGAIVVVTDDYWYCLSKGNSKKVKTKKLKLNYNKLYNNVKVKYGNTKETKHITNSLFAKKIGWEYERIRRK